MGKAEIEARLAAMNEKLDDTISGLDRGPVKDAIRLVVPMMKDQNRIMIAILNERD